MKKQHSELRRTKLHLTRRLGKLTKKQGDEVDRDLQNDLCSIMQDEQDAILLLPEDSFKHIFWEQQSQAALKAAKSSKKDCRGDEVASYDD